MMVNGKKFFWRKATLHGDKCHYSGHTFGEKAPTLRSCICRPDLKAALKSINDPRGTDEATSNSDIDESQLEFRLPEKSIEQMLDTMTTDQKIEALSMTLTLLHHQKAQEKRSKFADLETAEPGTVVKWNRSFGHQRTGFRYTYCAIKTEQVGSNCWWLAGKDSRYGMTLETLINGHLDHALAEGEKVWVSESWKELS
jgi:hypothetical protein